MSNSTENDVVAIPTVESGAPQMVPASRTASKRKTGGPTFHKQPCKCRPCSARRREEEARLRAAGSGEPVQLALVTPQTDVIDADLPSGKILRGGSRPDRTARGRVAEWVRWRALEPSFSNADIAKRIGISPKTLYAYLSRAAREGWLRFDDPISKLEFEIMPKVTQNLSEFLDAKDRTVTIEVAKGTLFKQFQESKGISDAPKTVLALKFEIPSGEERVARGVIMGNPKAIAEDDD